MLKRLVKKIVDLYFRNTIKFIKSEDGLDFESLKQNNFVKLPDIRPINILKVYKNTNWEDPNFLPALKKFGNVIEYPMNHINYYSLSWIIYKRQKFNKELLEYVNKLISEKKIDMIFFYVSALIISPKTLNEIKKLKIPTVNLSFDDTIGFKSYPIPGGYAGVNDICQYITVNVTSVKERLPDYYNQKAFCIYLPLAANEDVYQKLDLKKDIDVSFVGRNYGSRGESIKYLTEKGINVHAYGPGFPNGSINTRQIVEIFNRSKITLGFSEVSGLKITTLKARDFEAGLCGVFYLTSHNPLLAEIFKENEEIVFYRNNEELISKINYYLSHETEREQIADKFRQKCLKNHTWQIRFREIFSLLK
jgi:spore maturation protein CgeB